MITLPDGRTLHAQDSDASTVLSAVLGRPVVLARAQGDQPCQAEIDPATVFGDVPVEHVKPGSPRRRCPMPSRCRLAPSSTRPAFTCWRVARSPTCAR